jgi:2-dehydro-3-deoxy-D-arabinonate dehydratase
MLRYYRVRDGSGDVHLAVETEADSLASLTSVNEEVSDFRDLLRVSYIGGQGVDEIARHILSKGGAKTFNLPELIEWSRTRSGDARIIRPLDPDEMWAGGLGNYPMPPEAVASLPEASKTAYASERPPIMYKGTASRLAGPFDNIGIRSDVDKHVAEGELVLIIYKGRLVAYSTGHEVAGGLMSETLWWMVPSKVFKGCASLGPCVVTPESLPNPTGMNIELVITREGREEARVASVTALRRSPEDLVRWTLAHDAPPDLALLYSGGCVTAPDRPLQAGDVVRISMEGVGYVENTVELV